MAIIEQGILGGFSGRVGTVVGYHRHGAWFVRAYQPHINDRKSAAQLEQRSRFKAMIQFASPATGALRLGLRQMALSEGITEGNCFLKINKDRFVAEAQGGVGVDYPRLQFSRGALAGVALTECAVDERNVLSVGWRSLGGGAADRVVIYLWCPTAGRGLTAEADRCRHGLRAMLPQAFAGQEVHCWAFAVNQLGIASPTAYSAAGVPTRGAAAGEMPTGQSPLSPAAQSVSRRSGSDGDHRSKACHSGSRCRPDSCGIP